MNKKIAYIFNTIRSKYLKKNICFNGVLHADFFNDIYTERGGNIQIGDSVYIDKYTRLSATDSGHLTIGNHVYFNRSCVVCCRKQITIGDNCSFGPGVMIYDHDHGFNRNGYNNDYKLDSVIIGADCWIGAGTVILRGTTIGEKSVIGAGCVISGEIPSNSLVVSDRTTIITKLK